MQTPLSGTVVPAPFVRRWTPRRVILATLAVVSVVVGFFLMYRFSNALFVLFVFTGAIQYATNASFEENIELEKTMT